MRPSSPSAPILPLLLLVSCITAGGLWLSTRREGAPPAPSYPPVSASVATPSAAPAPVAPDPELARLRAEVKSLREQLESARGSLDQTNETLAQTAKELERLRRPLDVDMASATLRASLAPGEGVVTGGYRLPDGGRLFAFVETDPLPDGGIGVTSRLFAVPEELVQALGLQTLSTEAANTLQHGEVWVRDELNQIAGALEQTPGTRLVSAGIASLQPGKPGDVPLPTAPGDTPLSLNVNATYDDQRNLDLELRVESTPVPEPSADAPAPPPPAQ